MIIGVAILSFFFTNIYAQAANNLAIATVSNFDMDAANTILKKFNVSSFIEKASIKELQGVINSLTQLEAQAKKCIDSNTVELDKINKQLSEIFPLSEKPINQTAEQKYLTLKKKQLSTELSNCRLFVLRADDLMVTLNDQLRLRVKSQLFYASPNILKSIEQFPNDLKQLTESFDASLLLQHSGIALFNTFQGALFLIILLISIGVSLKFKSRLTAFIGKKTAETFFGHLIQIALSVFRKYLPFLLPLSILCFYITLAGLSSEQRPLLASISYVLIGYLFFNMLVRFYFYPPKPVRSLNHLPEFLSKLLIRRLHLLSILILMAYIVYLLLTIQPISETFVSSVRTFFITLIAINVISVIWLVRSLPKLYPFVFLRHLISFFLILGLVLILIAQWLGYHLIAAYLLHGIFFTAIAIFIARLFFKLVTSAIDYLNSSDHSWQIRFKRYFGLKAHEALPELLWLKILLYVFIWGGLLLGLLKIWGVAQTAFHLVFNALIHGFEIGHFRIIFLNITLGVVFFILLCAITRILCTHIVKNADIRLDKGNRESLASIVGYIGFGVAFIMGLLISGVNFSGLAFIAGALSVGIGFGLQNIVSNFISGLILLVERPVKPGDRIIVGDTEGYVRRISIRSTHIITLQKTDVIVPNSDLISKQVTNYMLYDTNFKIRIDIGLAYGSDTELAKNLLLTIAHSHPEVIHNLPGQEPTVIFKNFGDSTLNFELSCLIKDVDNKGNVISDLNFMIDKEFRENHIEIAFPQREITIKKGPISIAPELP